MKKTDTKPTPRYESECLNWTCGEITLKYEVKERPTVKIYTPKDLYDFILRTIDINELQIQEHFLAFYFNQNWDLLGYRTISKGSTNSCSIDVKQILTVGLILNAQQIMVAHNHPSNNINPSYSDLEITKGLVAAAGNCAMKLSDHLIITRYGFLSMLVEGLVKFN